MSSNQGASAEGVCEKERESERREVNKNPGCPPSFQELLLVMMSTAN